MRQKENNITEEKTYPTTKIVDSTRTIDWESVRIQTAIAAMPEVMRSFDSFDVDSCCAIVKTTVKLSNMLIEELKVKEDEI